MIDLSKSMEGCAARRVCPHAIVAAPVQATVASKVGSAFQGQAWMGPALLGLVLPFNFLSGTKLICLNYIILCGRVTAGIALQGMALLNGY
ncbi:MULTISPECIES: hypothetical protein [unclassified Janthinobacterium]|uniref:hypothetical protein n=1 Tax=unclassified Janthinobacterium TaxID=2610881 RepID=UPI0013050CAE|nr:MULTISPECIES: hypothetical protein [unclassified Janthinobacterium]MDZ5634609.1 hypothetical protein [Janthinobacterium sp. GMG1]